jgi:hypothetical protein
MAAGRTNVRSHEPLRFVFRYPHGVWQYGLLLMLVSLFVILAVDLLAEVGGAAGEAAPPPALLAGLTRILLVIVVAVASVDFLWLTVGREVVEISAEKVVVRHVVFGVGPRREFGRGVISAVFMSQPARSKVKRWLAFTDSGLFDFKRGRIGINVRQDGHALQTYRFAGGVHQREAEKVLAHIWAAFPHYAPRPSGRPAK